MSKTRDVDQDRRGFLKLASLAAPAAAATAVTGRAAQAEAAAPESRGLRKTEHVRKYLDTARF